LFETEELYLAARQTWIDRLRTDGLSSQGNWIGLSTLGPFATVLPGDTLQVTFALLGALKPEEFQGPAGKPVDTDDSRALLTNNALWARRTYAGEDNNFNGRLDPGEDVNGNGRLDRYVIPEPPLSPKTRLTFSEETTENGQQLSKVSLLWDRSSERSLDPLSGTFDFEGYRVYRSHPGDDLSGNILDSATLIAQFDTPGNKTGINNGFDEVLLSEPVLFPGDSTEYWYRLDFDKLLSGWQYLFSVTAFDQGDPSVGLTSFESSRVANATRVFPGTPASSDQSRSVGVYPNPYRVNAAWDGASARTRKLNFYNLPPRAEIRIYTLAGEIIARLDHDADTYSGDTRWYDDFSASNRRQPGGEHSWDVLSENGLDIASGLYLYTVKNLDDGELQRGKFAIIR
jgi:hypothetical protein